MAIARRNDARDIRALARQVHRRWKEYRRRHPGMSLPIDDTLSRILEHDPAYRPMRPRAAERRRPPLRNPGVFTLKAIANALETTVGDLLGEPGYATPRDALSISDRRKLRDTVDLLRRLFDLDDDAIGPMTASAQTSPFGFAVEDFIVRELGTPEPLRVWVAAAGADPTQTLREWQDPRLQTFRVIGDAMAPEAPNGSTVLIDVERTTPAEGELVVVYVTGEGGLLGRWHTENGRPSLMRSNPAHPPAILGDADDWIVLGTVTAVVAKTEIHRSRS